MDGTDMGKEAAVLFGGIEDVEGAGEGEMELLRRLRGRVADVARGKEDGRALRLVLKEVLKSTVRDWTDLPDGWEFDEDRKVWDARGYSITTGKRPTESARDAALKKESAKGSLARAERELGGGGRGGTGRDRGKGPELITKARGEVKRKEDVSEREAKEAVKARLKAEEEAKRKAERGKSNVGAAEKMLRGLGLFEKYGKAGGGEGGGEVDALVVDIIEMVKEGEKEEAEKGVESLVGRMGLVGGSAAKVRRYCLGGGKVDGGGKGGKGGSKGKGGVVKGKCGGREKGGVGGAKGVAGGAKGVGGTKDGGKGGGKGGGGAGGKKKGKKKDDLSMLDGF
ncbi:hypothetical protein TrCOL_g9292 [Triparma columacea]|uniref:Uncharacterized protein n=1 Tax=Triparma columacea TaxID=722753 RepID=A0A9W7GKS8_9STRA|nr:hypothetical protein TrCOL_g9292 [Triparma columacea]